ncbi:MAG: zf-HC2 domain-containing protein [Candidatus Sulfotelmatobacter sp.]
MRQEHLHVTDEELLLHADGEMPADSSRRIQAHLESCSQCGARSAELESTLSRVSEAHRTAWDAELPSETGPRAVLKTRLAELSAQESRDRWLRLARPVFAGYWQVAVLASVGIALLFLLPMRLHRPEGTRALSAALGHREEPDLRLTPGATVPVTEREVCGTTAKNVPEVPAYLKRKVFEEYGVTPPEPNEYEVDYLITPELGGATDIRNLWPEPYENTLWNAHVKDQLEDRLHRMVCLGDVDLATAQRDISTDWIAAYRKYFRVDSPAMEGSSFNFSSFTGSLPRT